MKAFSVDRHFIRQSNLSAGWQPVLLFVFKMYNFTSFAVSLNELEQGMKEVLAPTDCRLRPDIRHMENGEIGMYWRGGGSIVYSVTLLVSSLDLLGHKSESQSGTSLVLSSH